MKLRKIAVFLLVIVIVNFITPNISIFGAINEEYVTESTGAVQDDVGSNSTLLNWIAEIAFNFSYAVEGLGSKIIQKFTGEYYFPSLDKIIFNAIPILDVNFINPAPGSFFLKKDGVTPFLLGKIVRNIYFTALAIALSFFTIVVAILGIRLAVSSIGSEKAKYKEGIKDAAIAIVLVFGMHFLLSFIFFINEKLVTLASGMVSQMLGDNVTSVIDNLEAAGDENNEQMVRNFLIANNGVCFIEVIPIAGDIWQGYMDFIHSLGRAIGNLFRKITGIGGEQDAIAGDEIEKVYPSLDDYNEWFLKIDRRGNPRDTQGYTDEQIKLRTDVAAYLLKDKFYRSKMIEDASGNDVNTFRNSGLKGIGKNILICIDDVLGITDRGYKNVKGLFVSTALVVHGVDTAIPEIKLTEKDAYDHLSDEERSKFDGTPPESADFDAEYYSDRIPTVEAYYEYIEEAEKNLADAEKIEDKDERETMLAVAKLDMLYANAYYEYCLPDAEKPATQPNQLISGLLDYFESLSWYVNLDAGEWSPTYINPTAAILYTILIVQSIIILISYAKRFFYVVILGLISPFVVVYDFATKII